jgi:hypothetical protein
MRTVHVYGARPDDEIAHEKALVSNSSNNVPARPILKYRSFPMDAFSGEHEMLPPRMDMRKQYPPIVNQGGIGACTSAVLAAAYHCLYPEEPIGSRLFLYYNERDADGNVDIDRGSTLAVGVRSLIEKGMCSDKTWPYLESNISIKPSDKAYEEAAHSGKVESFSVHPTEIDIKACLAAGSPASVIIRVFQSFEDTGKDGMVYMPKQGDVDMGFHCIQLCGYDDERQIWIARNSWGADWGDKGYFYMPYQYLLSESVLSSSVHVLSKVGLNDDVPQNGDKNAAKGGILFKIS